jgi:hypothetical protein
MTERAIGAEKYCSPGDILLGDLNLKINKLFLNWLWVYRIGCLLIQCIGENRTGIVMLSEFHFLAYTSTPSRNNRNILDAID